MPQFKIYRQVSTDKLLLHVKEKADLKHIETVLFHQWPRNCGMHTHTTLDNQETFNVMVALKTHLFQN